MYIILSWRIIFFSCLFDKLWRCLYIFSFFVTHFLFQHLFVFDSFFFSFVFLRAKCTISHHFFSFCFSFYGYGYYSMFQCSDAIRHTIFIWLNWIIYARFMHSFFIQPLDLISVIYLCLFSLSIIYQIVVHRQNELFNVNRLHDARLWRISGDSLIRILCKLLDASINICIIIKIIMILEKFWLCFVLQLAQSIISYSDKNRMPNINILNICMWAPFRVFRIVRKQRYKCWHCYSTCCW